MNVLLLGKRSFADVLKGVDLGMGELSWIIQRAQCNPIVLKSREPQRDKMGGGGKEARSQRMGILSAHNQQGDPDLNPKPQGTELCQIQVS